MVFKRKSIDLSIFRRKASSVKLHCGYFLRELYNI